MNGKVGRPKLPEAKVKAEVIQVRVTSETMKEVQRVSRQMGLTPSSWARTLLLGALARKNELER